MKRFISLLLCAVIVAGAFCGCAAKKDNTNKEKAFELKYSYDSTYSSFDKSVYNAYEALCESVIKGEESARFNTGMIEDVNQLFYTSFPLNALVEKIDVKGDESGVSITYKNSKEEHIKKVEEFKNKVNEIMTKCYAGKSSKKLYTVNLYNYISTSVTKSDNLAITPYETIMTGKASSFSASNMFEYLLAQADVKAYHILAEDALKTGWGLSKAEYDGKEYYFDVYTEFELTEGKQLQYFGMTTEDVNQEGLKNLKYTNKKDAPVIANKEFEVCRSCDKWEIKDNKLVVTSLSGVTVNFDL